jgi:hypothetical protein
LPRLGLGSSVVGPGLLIDRTVGGISAHGSVSLQVWFRPQAQGKRACNKAKDIGQQSHSSDIQMKNPDL